ncbi:MAG: amidohydrolase family protein [Actinomycetia bacterium]|nr:amidohydrolase family protein [Actinomycetes bacterium]
MMPLTVRGTIIQTPTPGHIEVLEDHLVTVDDGGVIVSVVSAVGTDADVNLAENSLLFPGLIDTHIHAPQWPQLGTGLDLPLEEWLFEYTFPLEARFADEGFARQVWAAMVPRLLALGTTTAVYYASTHEPATLALAEACVEHGQRAFVGRVAMDHHDGTPEWYRDQGAAEAVGASERSIHAIRGLDSALVAPIITPRFIPACTDAALEGLGELAVASGALVQTHCSESDWEHGYVLDRYGRTDTESLHSFGLVRDHTVLAHATHLTAADRRIVVGAGAGVAHCPLSNSYFANAVFPARASIEGGLRVGLGTDVAGGSTASMLAQCQHAVTSSRMLEDGVDPGGATSRSDARIDAATAFWMATVGGADLLGIPAGLLAPGRLFDAFVVKTDRDTSLSPPGEADDYHRTFETIIRGSAVCAITQVWVGGTDVTPRRHSEPNPSGPE